MLQLRLYSKFLSLTLSPLLLPQDQDHSSHEESQKDLNSGFTIKREKEWHRSNTESPFTHFLQVRIPRHPMMFSHLLFFTMPECAMIYFNHFDIFFNCQCFYIFLWLPLEEVECLTDDVGGLSSWQVVANSKPTHTCLIDITHKCIFFFLFSHTVQ